MALKVSTSYQPKVGLKVTTKPVSYVTPKTVNPQRSVSPQPRTYNPQKTATVKQIQNYQPPVNWATQQATAMRIQADKQAYEQQVERKRLSDAKAGEINTAKAGFSKLLDKATFGQDRRSRGSRELAYKYYKDNEQTWGNNIQGRQRNYERKAGELKQWVLGAESEEEWNKRYSEAMKWLGDEYKAIDDDIKDYQKTQLELSVYSQTPLTTKVANVFNYNKDLAKKVGSAVWKPLEWTASQPERLVNTAKNLVNPDNLRLYYGGEEKQGGLDTGSFTGNIKKAYNESKDQRTLGFSQAEEQDRLAGGKPFQYKDWKTGEVKTGYTKPATGFNKFRIMYGDDIVNFGADPINYLSNSWASKGGKAIKDSKVGKGVSKFIANRSDDFYKMASKSEKMTNFLISQEAYKQNPNRLSKWLTRKTGTTMDDFVDDNKALIDSRNSASDEFSSKIQGYKGAIKDVAGDIPVRFGRLTDDEARIFQEYVLPQTFQNERNPKLAKEIFSWDGVDLPRGFNKGNQRVLEDLARDMKKATDKLRTMGIDYAEANQLYDRASKIRKFNNRSYIPNYTKGSSTVKKFDESMKLPEWYLKRKTGYSKQKPMDLAENFYKRVSSQIYSENPDARWLNSNASDYKGFIDDANDTLSKRKLGYEPNTFNKFNELSLKNKYSPTKLWTKAVLALNPAWYVNNLGTNIPFSISAGGAEVIPELFKIFKKGGRNFDDLPEGVLGKLGDYVGGGKAGKISRLADDPFRVATFRTLKKKGFTDEQAIKEVNKWFFDYKVRNFERPIKAVAPFYKWQANLMRLSAQMAFTNPRSAKFYNSMNQQFIERPLNKLPNETQEYTDPDSGETKTFNPRDAYRGKAQIGKDKDGNPKFWNTPFWGLNPNTITDFGLNPALTAGMDFFSSQDNFGNRNTDKSFGSLLADKLPQTSLAKSIANKNNKDTSRWFAEGGSSKWKQGYDKSLPNYDKYMDNQDKFIRKLKSFGGIPNSVTFDKANYDEKTRLTKFNKDFFAVDWNERYKDLKEEDKYGAYDKLEEEQIALAEKYGFDLKKDIYDKYWSKYDTATTSNTKRKKQDARDFASSFWNDYLSIPQGSKTVASKRRPFLIEKYREWARDNTFSNNGYRDIPEFSVYKNGQATEEKSPKNPFTLQAEQSQSEARRTEGKRKYQRYVEYQKASKSGDWSWFEKAGNAGVKKQSPFQTDGKFFKSQESMDKYKAGALWREYFDLSGTAKRRAFLDAHPEMNTFERPQSQAEWDELKQRLRKERNAKLDKWGDFNTNRQTIKKEIERTLPKNWGRTRRLRYKG